jgi:hypothetical protein
MVPVYDRKNTDRLLGYHPKWPLGDRFHRISVIPPLRVTAAYDPNDLMQCSVDYRSVELTRDYRYSDYGWKAEAIIVTDATSAGPHDAAGLQATRRERQGGRGAVAHPSVSVTS